MEYKVILEDGYKCFKGKVDEALEDGWRPQGGVSVCVHDATSKLQVLFSQAFIKIKGRKFR